MEGNINHTIQSQESTKNKRLLHFLIWWYDTIGGRLITEEELINIEQKI